VAEVDGMVLVYVPAGEFWMGATEIDPEASPAERPPHKVSLRAFWIDRTEVTNEMYSRCVGDGACRPPETENSATRPAYYGNPEFAGYPVIYVAWEDARDYCEWAERRLPTEAEWEKASRGTRVRLYPWGSQPPDANRANYNSRVGDTQPANAYPDGASPYGALNMSGNVAEWVADWFGDGYYSVSTFANPTGPETGEFRVIRGGSWYNLGRAMRSAFRLWNYPDLRSDTVGFRCAR
jgi:formylglycine-generating enzyme required for sulfatase activity